jgi:hypothetical protein
LIKILKNQKHPFPPPPYIKFHYILIILIIAVIPNINIYINDIDKSNVININDIKSNLLEKPDFISINLLSYNINLKIVPAIIIPNITINKVIINDIDTNNVKSDILKKSNFISTTSLYKI